MPHMCAFSNYDWTLTGESRQKIVEEVAALKNDECMHPLTKIEGCTCPLRTLRTRTNKGPAIFITCRW